MKICGSRMAVECKNLWETVVIYFECYPYICLEGPMKFTKDRDFPNTNYLNGLYFTTFISILFTYCIWWWSMCDNHPNKYYAQVTMSYFELN